MEKPIACVGCGRTLAPSDSDFAAGKFVFVCGPACHAAPVLETLDGLAGLLRPGQSVVVARPTDDQRTALAEAELGGEWAITVAEPGGDEGEECTLFADDDRGEAIRRACGYLSAKNEARP